MAGADDKRAPAVAPSSTSSSQTPTIMIQHGGSILPDASELRADEGDAPPAYSEHHDHFDIHQAGFDAGVAVTDDGRVNININQKSGQLADFIAPTLRNQLRADKISPETPLPPPYIPPSLGGRPGQTPPPRLNVVIQIVGSRGDVQPFVALGQVLKDTYGHRVRIATHPTFQKFVEENGLEFFSISGDPAELMAFMVKNPGLMPGMDALKSGEITKRRMGIEQIIMGCWRSCIEPGDGLGPAPRFGRKDRSEPIDLSSTVVGDSSKKPFVADAIIANPAGFAHIHIAEKLGVPLHLMFTMPWSPTRAFPQPLANIQSSNTDPVTTNYLSYAMVEMMTWQGLGDVINRFRTKVLGLEALSLIWAPGLLTRLRIPYTYCWSPALIPKPNDWGSHIDIAGFFFLNLASSYTPEPDLAEFLAAGPPPVYIGFGSIVVEDPDALTKMIFDAVRMTGVRALVSKGWGGLGADNVGIPDSVFMLGNVPHDWLFKHVSAVCHHGGAGTTAAGIQAGKPTIVVPFFGDQPFWGAMVARAGAGPDPIPYKKLTAEGLAEAIQLAIRPETQEKAQELGEKIREERGPDVGGQSFHSRIDFDQLRCAVVPSRVAVWRVRRSKVRLSALAAATLVNHGYLQYSDLKLFRAREYNTEDHPTDPISACTSALVGDLSSIFMSAADVPRDLFKATAKQPTPQTAENTADRPTTGSQHDDETTASENADLAKDGSSVVSHPLSTTETWKSESTHDLGSMSSMTSVQSGGQSLSQASNVLRQQTGFDAEKMIGAKLPEDMNQRLGKAIQTGKNINNIVTTGVKTPMNFCMSLARGFRNVPTLYNDDTVRPVEKVTDFSSGLKVAGKEFGFGLFDGITGLVTQPLKGAEKEGGAGLLKGFGKGIGGLVTKPAAGFWSIPAYTMAGVHAEIRSRFAQNAQGYIVASRIAQGNDDLEKSSAEERDDIEVRWLSLNSSLKGFQAFKQKQKGKSRDTEQTGKAAGSKWPHFRTPSSDNRQTMNELEKAWKGQRAGGPSLNEQSPPRYDTHSSDLGEEYETAIQAAVRQTSQGDAAEDARLEQAMRSSVGVLRRRSTVRDPASSATNTSKSDPTGPALDQKSGSASGPLDFDNITDEEYQELIAEAMRVSMEDQHIRMYDNEQDDDSFDEDYQRVIEKSRADDASFGGGAVDDDEEDFRKALHASQADHDAHKQRLSQIEFDEEALQKAIQASQDQQQQQPAAGAGHNNDDDDEDLRRALEESERAHEAELARASTMKSEEDIVLEYVKKQSLAEAEFRNKAQQKGKSVGGDSNTTAAGAGVGENDDDDEELRRALEESLRTDDGSSKRGGGGGPSRFS